MEVPITRFRQKIFELVNEALEGKEVWVSHKGRRVRLVPEDAPSKLSRITPMDIIAGEVDSDDDSWKAEMMRDWEQKWDRRLGPVTNRPGEAPQPPAAERPGARHKA